MKKIFKFWYIFVIGIVISVASFLTVSSIFSSPKAYERFNIYCSSYALKQNLLINKLNESKNPKIYEINVQYSISTDASNANTIFNATCEYQDTYILPASQINDSTRDFYLSRMLPFDESLIKSYLGLENVEFMTYNNKTYGIKIYDSESKTGFLKDYITYESDTYLSDYYLFISPLSMTVGELNNSPNSFGLDIIKAMFTL